MEFENFQKPSLWTKFKRFVIESKRVFIVTKKPTKEEYKIVVKVTSIGLLIIGAVGFIIAIIWQINK